MVLDDLRSLWISWVVYSTPRLCPMSLRQDARLGRLRFWERLIASLGLLIFLGAGAVLASSAEKTSPDEHVEERTVTGDVVSVGRSFISVETAKTKTSAEEMMFWLDKGVRVEGPKQLSQLQPGDRVSVQYLQTYRVDDAGERVILKTVATKVALLRSAAGEGALRSADDTVSE